MNRLRTRRIRAAMLGLISSGWLGSALGAQEPGPSSAEKHAAALPEQPTLTKSDVDAWLDGYMPYALAAGNVAGAVVVVVKDGHVLTERGYGYADVAANQPVDPRTTLFRPASTSKLFTWTAVMQQVQAGKIDLDRDVNDYLDFKIPPYDSKPITMRNLLTHTAGFEERIEDLVIKSDRVPSIRDAVTAWIPHRIFPPGSTPAYSNYGALLAGYIVERVSGEPYDDYIDRHIFRPLGMKNSTMREPLPANMNPAMSKGYPVATQPPVPFEITAFRPAGSATTTADDMGRFMLANLDEANNPLLEPDVARAMHTTALSTLPPLNSMLLGFYEHNLYGLRIIGHGGDTEVFHSYLWLLPGEKTGVFFSMNSRGEGVSQLSMREGLIENLVKRYFPQDPPAASTFQPNPQDAASLSGSYVASRRAESNFTKLLGYLDEVTVSADSSGNVDIPGDLFAGPSGAPRNWSEIAPLVWKDKSGSERFAAELKDGKAVRIATDSWSPFLVFDRVPWYEARVWLEAGMIASILLLLGLPLSLPLGALARRYYRGTKRLEGSERIPYLLCLWFAVATLVVVLVWLGLFLNLTFARLPRWVYVLQLATIAVPPVLCAAALWFLLAGIATRRAILSIGLRATMVLVSLWTVWFVFVFNFAHLGLDY